MPLIEWSPTLEIGIPEIDYQHRTLVSMLNALGRGIEQGEPATVIGEILEALDGYVHTHFASEERLMQRLGYEFIEEHKEEHHRLAETVSRHRAAYSRGECSPQELLEFLIRWLLNHIAGADSYIAEAWRKQQAAA
jgi:hemerythrin-like metal-binding protein